MNDLESLLDNEREWRRYLITEVGEIKGSIKEHAREISAIKVWSTVFRILTGAVFAVALVWIEYKLK